MAGVAVKHRLGLSRGRTAHREPERRQGCLTARPGNAGRP